MRGWPCPASAVPPGNLHASLLEFVERLAYSFKLDDDMRRRLRAKAAYDDQPDPNLDDPNVAKALFAGLGNWGVSAEQYTVRRGDSLSKIATTFYGDRNKWRVIVYYNNISHPSLVEPGETYLIPKPEPTDDARVALPGFGGPSA